MTSHDFLPLTAQLLHCALIIQNVNNWGASERSLSALNGTNKFTAQVLLSRFIQSQTIYRDLLRSSVILSTFLFLLSSSFIWLVTVAWTNHGAHCRCADVTSWWSKVQHLLGIWLSIAAIWSGRFRHWSQTNDNHVIYNGLQCMKSF
jgi:hypothetical protein